MPALPYIVVLLTQIEGEKTGVGDLKAPQVFLLHGKVEGANVDLATLIPVCYGRLHLCPGHRWCCGNVGLWPHSGQVEFKGEACGSPR